jgi:hypothetical protein
MIEIEISGNCSARELIDAAKKVFGVSSAYAVAGAVNLPPRMMQRYYSKNRMPRSARNLILQAISR